MGLIKALFAATSSTLADQWKEYFYCDSLNADVLVAKGVKKVSSRSSNTKGSDNIITTGSQLVVNEGQCMLIVEQGKIVDVCAEAGAYTYDQSTEPSVFCGSLSEGIKETFKTIGKRFTYGGDTAKDQRVYYVNIKEIMDNKFGTATPIPFRVVDKNINLDIDVAVRCNGVYSYKIVDPLLFYTNVCANVSGEYRREEIDSQLKTEFVSALQPCFGRISEMEVRPNALPNHVDEIAQFMNETLTEKWGKIRGLQIVSIGLNPVTLPEEDAALIKDAQRTAMMKDQSMAAARLVDAQAEAMKTAAGNENGAMMGFMGLNMATQAGGASPEKLFAMANEQAQAWVCSCGTKNTGNFCTNCGTPRGGKVEPVKCSKCGYVPEDPQNPPKFCPECGTPFQK